MRPSSRLEKIAPYLFAELERKIAAKRAAGIDVISLGIGDPDTPTYPPIVAAAQRAVADPSTHQYPSNRGRAEFREAVASFYERRFGVTLDPETEAEQADPSASGQVQPCVRLPYLSLGSAVRIRNECADRAAVLPVTSCSASAREFCDRCVKCGTSPRVRVADLTIAAFVELGGNLEDGCFNATLTLAG